MTYSMCEWLSQDSYSSYSNYSSQNLFMVQVWLTSYPSDWCLILFIFMSFGFDSLYSRLSITRYSRDHRLIELWYNRIYRHKIEGTNFCISNIFIIIFVRKQYYFVDSILQTIIWKHFSKCSKNHVIFTDNSFYHFHVITTCKYLFTFKQKLDHVSPKNKKNKIDIELWREIHISRNINLWRYRVTEISTYGEHNVWKFEGTGKSI